MTNVLGYSRQEIEQAPTPKDQDPRGLTTEGMAQLLDTEEQIERQRTEEAEAFATEMGFGFGSHMGKAFVQESAIANAASAIQDFAEPFDVNYTLDSIEKDINEHGEGLPPWATEDLRSAKSPEHFQALLAKVHKQHVYNQEAEYLGGMGMAAQMAGIMISPETLLLGIGESALLAKFALTGAKRIAAFGGVAAVSNVGQELMIMENDNSRSEAGLIMAGAMGFGFGAVVGKLAPDTALVREAKLHKAVADDIAGSIAADTQHALETTVKSNRAITAPVKQNTGDIAESGMDSAGSAGASAAAAPAIDTPLNALVDKIPFLRKPVKKLKSHRPKWLQSMAARGLDSDNPVERQVYDALVENAAGTGGKTVATHSAYLRGEIHTMRMRSAFHPVRDQGWADWKATLKKNGQWDPRRIAQEDFDDEVYEELVDRFHGRSNPDQHPAIIKVADAYNEVEKMRFDTLQKSGVSGYQDAAYVDGLTRQRWDSAKMHRVARSLTEDGTSPKDFIVNLLKKSILHGTEFQRKNKYSDVRAAGKFDDAFMDRTAGFQAEAIYDRFIKRPVRGGTTSATLLTKQDRAKLDAAVKSLTDDPAQYKNIMSSLNAGDRRAVDDTLSQIRLDANFEIDGWAPRDMLDTSMGRNLDTKFRKDGGRAGLAEVGIDSEDTFLELKEAVVAEELNLSGGDGIKDVQRFGDEKSEEMINMYRLILGENIEKDAGSRTSRALRGLRQLTTLSAMNQVGFAQSAEIGRLASAVGVKSMLTNIAEFGSMRRDMISGKLKSPMLRDFEAVSGVRLGDNHLVEHAKLRSDAGGHTLAHEDSPWFMKMVDSAMQKGLHVQGYINGMNMIMRYQHRAHTKGMMMRTFEELNIKGIDKLSDARLRRYADTGLSKADLTKAQKMMSKYSTETNGWFGQRRLDNLNLAKWDSDIREKMILAIHKNQAQSIQRNLVGETPLWMETSMGKMMSQFKTFPMVALEKQLIHDMKHFDAEAFLTSVYSLSIASTLYMTRTYANSFGLSRSKRRKYLKNRLTPDAIAQGAINWSGQASIIPDAMNAAGAVFGINPFQYTATKGAGFRQAGDLKLGALGPGPNMVNSAYRFATGLGQAVLNGEELTGSTFRHGTRLIPFNNALGVRNFANVISNQFK